MEARAAGQGFALDAAQREALAAFERVGQRLADAQSQGRGWKRFLPADRGPATGLYLWGGVGRGKSFLMDGFFEFASEPRKQREHFHRFMQGIHRDLRRLQGRAEPMQAVAQRVAEEARLWCLDEFQVTDIGDAMLMRRLLEGLFERGVTLVTTSNTAPGDLYLHGLQRAQFVPAVELLQRHLDVVRMDGGFDYRQRALEQAGTWHAPLGEAAARALAEAFLHVAGSAGHPEALEIEGRAIDARRVAGGVAWFDFETLCGGPRAQADYIELARRFHTVVLDGVPRFAASGEADRMRRLAWLVDEFYDRRVKLIVAAAAPAMDLYSKISTTSEQDRTASRLVEMQSHQYLGEAHLG
jgi:cell division protein ZapE